MLEFQYGIHEFFILIVGTEPHHAFDASLRARNPDWGLRPVSWIDGLAEGGGFDRSRKVEMPANNLMLVYRRWA